ncbi:MAG: hypothetical protein EBV25_02870 [Methylophilaceae bacterium]|nr:hypothetical protein [Methylophilaceae bacterium]
MACMKALIFSVLMTVSLVAWSANPMPPIDENSAIYRVPVEPGVTYDDVEFVVFAPCRIGIYEQKGQLYLAIDRPTYDLKSIKNLTPRAKKAAQELESTLIQIIDKARKGDI